MGILGLLAAALVLTGCSSMYYNTLENFGYEKRDILVSRVQDARQSQLETKEQFESALEQFQAVVGHDGGDLEKKYRTLNTEFQRCEAKAKKVGERINSIESVAGALFREWEKELDQYSDPSLRLASERQLGQTKERYNELVTSMRDVERRIDPVLAAFRDRVLFLKHNLNAQAIASLEGDLGTLENDVAQLVNEMNASIEVANEFLAQMEKGK
ncbi:MAG: DUF2959 domain-containing protein [Candidatus Sumerlaeia bacterium]|nr:DUF2959 domain-containing protein [Candidatus Sumerlaeia bacterium]